MSITRKAIRSKAEAKKKIETHELKAAYIIPAEAGDKMLQALGELPSKYFQSHVSPMADTLQKAFRGDITVTIDPNKPAPAPPGAERPKPEPASGKATTEELPK
jgi:hypothetical protein